MQRITYVSLMLYSAAYLLLFGTWVAISFNQSHVPNPGQLIGYIQDTLAALTGHVVTMINPAPIVVAPTLVTPIQSAPTLVTRD